VIDIYIVRILRDDPRAHWRGGRPKPPNRQRASAWQQISEEGRAALPNYWMLKYGSWISHSTLTNWEYNPISGEISSRARITSSGEVSLTTLPM
jgi:hypothetical protein